MTALLLLHAAATLAMAGLVWFVQVVHYPLFAAVGEERFREYEVEHTRRTTLVVAPLMGVEAVTALALVALEPSALASVGVALVVAVWASTALVQVPCHRTLSRGWDAAVHRRLVRTNALRALLWSARACVALLLLL